MRIKNTLICGLILLLSCDVEAGHRILLGSYGHGNDLTILDENDQVEWRMPGLKKVTDVQWLPDGHILYAHTSGVSEITPDYKSGVGGTVKLLWKVPPQSEFVGDLCVPKKDQKGETHSCQLLPDGRILVGLSYHEDSYVLEIDRAGTVCKKIRVSNYGTSHGSFRNIRKTRQGSYLLTRNGKPHVGLEIDGQGKRLREFKDGRYVMIRLPNGNTLVAGSDAHRLFEVNETGREVWSVEQDDLPCISLAAVCGVQRLANGNTLLSSWGGHGDRKSPAVIEVTRDKKVVWKSPDFIKNRVLSLQVLDMAPLALSNALR